MGYIGFNVVVAIAQCRHLHSIPHNPFAVIKIFAAAIASYERILRSVHTMRFCLQFDANAKNGFYTRSHRRNVAI